MQEILYIYIFLGRHLLIFFVYFFAVTFFLLSWVSMHLTNDPIVSITRSTFIWERRITLLHFFYAEWYISGKYAAEISWMVAYEDDQCHIGLSCPVIKVCDLLRKNAQVLAIYGFLLDRKKFVLLSYVDKTTLCVITLSLNSGMRQSNCIIILMILFNEFVTKTNKITAHLVNE